MQLTKFTHSCVRLDDGDRTLVIDPGAFSEVTAALDGAEAVLITHEHFDHVELEQLRGAAQRDPRLRIWAPAPVAEALAELGEQVSTVGAGEAFDAAGFGVRTFGRAARADPSDDPGGAQRRLPDRPGRLSPRRLVRRADGADQGAAPRRCTRRGRRPAR